MMNNESVDEGHRESPARCVDQAALTICQQGCDGSAPISNPDASDSVDRSELDDWRVSLHEGGHTVVGRALGSEVGGCTIIEGPDFSGKTWGPLGNSARLSSVDEQPDLCEKIAHLMPAFGEPRSGAADIFAHVHVRIVDLMAGTAAETVLHPDCPPWTAHSDIRQARSLASIICTSESAIDFYLKFAAEEAKALITTHRAAVLAIAESLMIHRTLDSTQIDEIIAQAMAYKIMKIEIERRKRWATTLANAAEFSARENGII
jgi:hypothetical protein